MLEVNFRQSKSLLNATEDFVSAQAR